LSHALQRLLERLASVLRRGNTCIRGGPNHPVSRCQLANCRIYA
jgi:hypothetical protein